jgi:hypothetical protein
VVEADSHTKTTGKCGALENLSDFSKEMSRFDDLNPGATVKTATFDPAEPTPSPTFEPTSCNQIWVKSKNHCRIRPRHLFFSLGATFFFWTGPRPFADFWTPNFTSTGRLLQGRRIGAKWGCRRESQGSIGGVRGDSGGRADLDLGRWAGAGRAPRGGSRAGFGGTWKVKMRGPPGSYLVRWVGLAVGYMRVAGAAGRSASVGGGAGGSVLGVRNLGLEGRLRGRVPSENWGSAHFSHGALDRPGDVLYVRRGRCWAVAERGPERGEVCS